MRRKLKREESAEAHRHDVLRTHHAMMGDELEETASKSRDLPSIIVTYPSLKDSPTEVLTPRSWKRVWKDRLRGRSVKSGAVKVGAKAHVPNTDFSPSRPRGD